MVQLVGRITPKPIIRALSPFHGSTGKLRKNLAGWLWCGTRPPGPTSAHNIAVHPVESPVVSGETDRPVAASAEHVSDSPVLLYNANSLVANGASVHLLICSIFETKILSLSQQRLFESICALPHLWGDRSAMVKAMRKELLERLQNDSADALEHLANLQRLSIHEQKTRESLDSYSPHGGKSLNVIFWPNPNHQIYPTSVYEELPFVRNIPLVNKTTPIGSAGSCFSTEIAYQLQRDGYNYVVTEPHDGFGQGQLFPVLRRPLGHAIFNTPSFRQLVERAFGLRIAPKLLWSRESEGKTIYLDPFREEIVFKSIAEFESNYEPHRLAARLAFMKCKVFIFTLGMNEVWRFKADGSVLSRASWRLSPDLVERRILTVQENVDELECMLAVLRQHNPDLKLILSVSPVPLHATFRGDDTHVITANCHSKSILRVAAEQFALQNKNIYYFPSYETVVYCTEKPWEADQRHVCHAAVDRVMRLFYQMFVDEKTAGLQQ